MSTSPDLPEALADVQISQTQRIEYNDTEVVSNDDWVACEEPLEIRVRGFSLAVVMRTPGHDEELATGFLVTEQIVPSATLIRSIRYCTEVDIEDAEENILQVNLEPSFEIDLERFKRNLYVSSSCGICGKASIVRALQTAPPLEDNSSVSIESLYRMPGQLRKAQAAFDRTGGLHAVALFDPHGNLLVAREDIGRHNAVDKVVGWATSRELVLTGHTLMVSGRVSFEIVQKALAARIPIIAAVSAPSSLGIELARAGSITLVGFLRGRSARVYAGDERIERA